MGETITHSGILNTSSALALPAPLIRRALQERLELRLIDTLVVGFVRADPLLLEHLHDRIVKGLHPELFAHLDGRGDLEGLVLPDQVGNGRRDHHDLERSAPYLLIIVFVVGSEW